jgi:RNAse (barnase) inhibitor barstar
VTEFSVVLRGYDRDQVDRLIERAQAAMADPALRAAVRAEIAAHGMSVVVRGYDRQQVEDTLARYAAHLTSDAAGVPPAADVGYELLVNGFVTLFHDRAVLDRTISRLRAARYQVDVLDAATWTTEADMHAAFAATLGFPDYFGRNLDALNDCLRDVVDQRYGWLPEATGLVLVFTGFDAFTRRYPKAAQAVLDIVAGRSRDALLAGRRLIALVQSDDARIAFDPVGATPVLWNDAEWPDAQRS